MENLSGENRKVDDNELRSSLIPFNTIYRIRFEGKEEKKKKHKENERVNRNRAGDDMFGGDWRVEALEK